MAIGRDRNSIVPAVPYHFVCCSILLHFTFVHSPIPSHCPFFILYLPFERHLWPSVGTAIPLCPLFHTISSAVPYYCILLLFILPFHHTIPSSSYTFHLNAIYGHR